MLRAVVFDVDFTIARPGPDLGPLGYQRAGERFGLMLDPSRYEAARLAALETLERHPELEHDEEIWILFTQRIVEGMGGVGDTYGCASELTRAWENAGNFDLFDDAVPVLGILRDRGLKVGLLSNSARDLGRFVTHHDLTVDAVLTSRDHGKTKPHEAIFLRMLELLDVQPREAVMVGDQLEDDIEGARAVGMQALLIDRDHRHPEVPGRLSDLRALPEALGLN